MLNDKMDTMTIICYTVVIGILLILLKAIIKALVDLHKRREAQILVKVAQISTNYKRLREIQTAYKFEPLQNYNRKIDVVARSYKKYKEILGRDVIRYHIEQNVDGLREDIALAIRILPKYQDYLAEIMALNLETPFSLLTEFGFSPRKFRKYEARLIKRSIITDPSRITVKIRIYYRSPAGRKYYEKNGTFGYGALLTVFKGWQKHRDYKVSAKYERSLMSDSLRYDILKRDNFRCCICGASAKDGVNLHVDHIIPVSKGGKTIKNNLQTLCDRCNLGKSNKL